MGEGNSRVNFENGTWPEQNNGHENFFSLTAALIHGERLRVPAGCKIF